MDPNLAGFAAAMATSEQHAHHSSYLEQQHYSHQHQHQHHPQEQQQQQYQHPHHQQQSTQHPSYYGTESSLEQTYAMALALPQNPTVAPGPHEPHPADQPYNPAAPQVRPHLHLYLQPGASAPPSAAMMPHPPHPPVSPWGGVAASSSPFAPPSLVPPHNFLPGYGADMPPGVDPAHHLPSHHAWHDEIYAPNQQHLPPHHQPHPPHHHHQQHVLHQPQPHHPHPHPWMQPVPGLQGGAMPRPGMAVPRFNSTIGMAKRPAKVWPKKLKKSSIKKPLSDKPDKTTVAAPKEKAPKSGSAFCTLCHLDCTTEFALQQHMNGKRHKRQLQRQEENGRKAGDSKGPVTNVRGKARVPVAAAPAEAVANVRGKAAVSVAALTTETVTSAQGESTVSVVGGNIANVLEQMWLQVSMMGKGHKSGKARGRGRKRPRSEMTGEGKIDSNDAVERGDATIKASRSEMTGEGLIHNKGAMERGDATIKAENGFVEATLAGEKDPADAMTIGVKCSADERTEDEKCPANARTECGKGPIDATPDGGERGFMYARTGDEKDSAEATAVSDYLMNAIRADESNIRNISQAEGKFILGVKVDSEKRGFPSAYNQSEGKGFAITAFEGEEKNVLCTTAYKQNCTTAYEQEEKNFLSAIAYKQNCTTAYEQEEKNVLSATAYVQDQTDALHVSFGVEQSKASSVASLAAENAFGSKRPGPNSPLKQQEQTKCELCNIQCQTKAVLESHLAGKKHANRLRLSQKT